METTGAIVGSGKYTYEVNEDWARLPDGWAMPAAAVTVDSQDRVYCFNRTPDHPIVVFDREGNYLSSWGAGLFAFPHTIRVDADDNLWLVDRDHGQMLLFTSEGTLLRTVGTRGHRSDTGVSPQDFSSAAYRNVTHGGGPFNLPTDIALTPSGEMFMTDGYGTHGCTSSPRTARISSLGASRARARDSSTCPTACGSTAAGECSSATARTTACRCSTRRGSSSRSGRPS